MAISLIELAASMTNDERGIYNFAALIPALCFFDSLLFNFRQISARRAVDDFANAVETRAVTRAIPGFFLAVPSHDAAEMWAHR